MIRTFIILVILNGFVGIQALADTQNPTTESCLTDIKVWADIFSQKGESRTLHFYRPVQDENSDTITLNLYTPMEVYCEDGCERTELDDSAYTFFRSTHYWSLDKVFKEHLSCGYDSLETKRNILLKPIQYSFEIETNVSRIKLTWNNKKCALKGASEVDWGGCISIKNSPKN